MQQRGGLAEGGGPGGRRVEDRLVRVSKNGNMLLNIAPMADGTIPQAQKDILLGIGVLNGAIPCRVRNAQRVGSPVREPTLVRCEAEVGLALGLRRPAGAAP